MSETLNYYNNLLKVMRKTSGTRFSASEKLYAVERLSVSSLTLLSIFLIGFSVFSIVPGQALSITTLKQLGVLATVASVGVLAITLYDFALGRGVLAYRLHKNAIKINFIMRSMERECAKPVPNLWVLESLAASYENEIADTEVNHTSTDFALYMLNQESPGTPTKRLLLSLRKTRLAGYVYFKSLSMNLVLLGSVTFGLVRLI